MLTEVRFLSRDGEEGVTPSHEREGEGSGRAASSPRESPDLVVLQADYSSW